MSSVEDWGLYRVSGRTLVLFDLSNSFLSSKPTIGEFPILLFPLRPIIELVFLSYHLGDYPFAHDGGLAPVGSLREIVEGAEIAAR